VDLNPLNQLNPYVIVSVMIVFSVTGVLLRKLFFLPYIEVMERRAQRLEAADAMFEEAERIVVEAEAEAAEGTTRAREKVDLLLRETREKTETYRRETVDAAMAEVATLLEQGRSRIAEARENEMTSLRTQAVECVNLACSKLMGSSDEESTTAAVDKLLARRVH